MEIGRWPTGVDARVTAVDVAPADLLRLGELGLRTGARVRVTHKAAFGGRVVAVGTDRFAVDARTCAHIQVGPLGPGPSA